MDRSDDAPEPMESSDGRWVVVPDPRTGLFWRMAPPEGFVADCGHAVNSGDLYDATIDGQRVCAACMRA